MHKLIRLIALIFVFVSFLSAQTTQTYFEDFEKNNEIGWTFTAVNGSVITQNGFMNFTSPDDNIVYMFPPIGAVENDFSIKVKGGGNSAGGFGRAGFNSIIAIHIEDSISVLYTENIQSYADPNFTWLANYPIPDIVNSLELTVSRSGDNLIINAYVNDNLFYNGTLINPDEGLFYGQMCAYMIKGEEPIDFSLDEVEINYNPYIKTTGTFNDEFSNSNSPWFRFGDFQTIAQSVNISNGQLKFNFSGAENTTLYTIPPVGAVKDFSIELAGSGSNLHNAPFGISRFFDYKNYVTFFIEDNAVHIGYAIDSMEPVVLGSAEFNPTEISKIKFSVEGDIPNLTMNVWINDNLLLTETMNNAPERLLSGRIAVGYDRGNVMDAYLEYAYINYEKYEIQTPQTSLRYNENFEINNESGWAFLAPDADIFTENGELKLSTYLDDYIHIFPPLDATIGDFSFEIKSGTAAAELDGGGFGRIGFKSMIGILISNTINDGFVNLVYTEDINSYSEPALTILGSYPLSEDISSMKLEVVQVADALLIRGLVNGQIFYEGELTNYDESLLYGKMFLAVDPNGSGNLSEWSLGEIDIKYNNYIENKSSFMEDFNSENIPWFRFGDFDNIVPSVSVNNGYLNFNYNGTEETSLFVMSPVGAVKDFAIEIEGSGSGLHNAPFGISRVFDYKNYVTFFVEDDALHLGYAQNSWEPIIINQMPFNLAEIQKVKFTVEGTAPNLTLTAMINDQTTLSGTISDASKRLEWGHLAFGYDRGNIMAATINNVFIDYTNFITNVETENPIIVNEFSLFQNYPNPFNPTTVIKYSIPSSQFVSLKVYDILGKEVAALVNEQKKSGTFSVEWNASDLSSGVYLYRLQAGNNTISNKMLLIK